MNINSTIAMPLKFYTPTPDRAPQTTEPALSDVLTDQKKKRSLGERVLYKGGRALEGKVFLLRG
ncbi:hypothetical protein [Pseudomonas viridiflava]|uniref:hypothetical protein n=1 Tax=Pseudomonas viridiflava TaxID=33069 RepID=UPI0013DFBAF7|nr:hypothetical protein [Pseudomonas viridiflava]